MGGAAVPIDNDHDPSRLNRLVLYFQLTINLSKHHSPMPATSSKTIMERRGRAAGAAAYQRGTAILRALSRELRRGGTRLPRRVALGERFPGRAAVRNGG